MASSKPRNYAPHSRMNPANLIGLQFARILLYLIQGPGNRLTANLGEQGYRVERDFLKPEEFLFITNVAYEVLEQFDYEQTCNVLFYPDGRIECNLDSAGKNPQLLIKKDDKGIYNEVIKILEKNKFSKFFENYGRPWVEIETVRVMNGEKDVGDHNQEWHRDKYEECHKAWLFLDDHSKDNGTMEYWPGSHMLDFKQMLYEYVFSVKYLFEFMYLKAALKKLGFKFNKYPVMEGSIFQPKGTPLITEFPKNTLFISNNAAFHRRGVCKEGHQRLQIALTFYHLGN